jgi:hypothetical protein
MVLRASVTSEQSGLVCLYCSRDETSRKIPNTRKAHLRAVETLSQSIDIPRSFQPKDEMAATSE